MNDKFSIYCSRMANDLFKILEINLEETSEMERQVIAAFLQLCILLFIEV